MIIKRNRGRQWLDWERRMVTGAYYVGVAVCLLMLTVLVFGDMGLPRYFSMREHAQQLDVDLQELQRSTRTLREDIDRVEHDPGKSNSWRENNSATFAKVKPCINWSHYHRRSGHARSTMKFGTVAIIGRPNVGKSTLLNRLLEQKIAIVSDKPQTTRTRILGIVHAPGAQIALLDTPGLHKPQHLLNRRMVRTTVDVLEEADILYVLMDTTSSPGPGDLLVIDHVKGAIRKRPRPVILVLNKVDLVNKLKLLPVMETYARLFGWTEVVPVSAETGDNVDRLLSVTVAHLSEGDAAYDADTVTDQSMRTLAAEMIREKILHQTYEEVPYSVAVEIDEFVEEGKLARISATVLVERESHKAIVIGKHGERLKEVGTDARRDMEQIFGMKVFLQLWVKVREAWREDEHALTELGY